MTNKQRQDLEEKQFHLERILDYYVNFRKTLKSMNDTEIDEYIDGILDEMLEIKRALKEE